MRKKRSSKSKKVIYSFSELAVENFKTHEKIESLELKPITILIGPNSSGKTAFFQPLLLLKQSLTSESKTIEPLSLNGDLVTLGAFSDFVYAHDTDRTVKIGCTLKTKDSVTPSKIFFEFFVAYDKENQRMKLTRVSCEDPEAHLGFRVIESRIEFFHRDQILFDKKIDSPFSLSSIADLYGMAVMKTMTAFFSEIKKGLKKIEEKVAEKKIAEKKIATEETASNENLENLMNVSNLFPHLSTALVHLSYVGPLREYPKRFYQTSGERFLHVGKRGERAVEIICNEEILGREEIQCKLSYWLKLLNIAEKIRFRKLGESLFALLLKTPVGGIEVNVADVGFGVSQIIPVIVETCILDKNDTLILEQPEIHLHPLGQMVMADLIIEAANHGRRFIVETHSEHLLLRIQRRVAEGKIASNKVAIYYFEPTKEQVVIHKLRISERGQFENLPPGFMDERLEEAYSIASAGEDRTDGF